MADTPAHPLRGLLIAQFCGAFNDNAWKLMVALLAIRQATAQMAPGAHETAHDENILVQGKPRLLQFGTPNAAITLYATLTY